MRHDSLLAMCLDTFFEIQYTPEKKMLTPAFPRSIPKSASGKILRRVLRDQAKVEKSAKIKENVVEKAKL